MEGVLSEGILSGGGFVLPSFNHTPSQLFWEESSPTAISVIWLFIHTNQLLSNVSIQPGIHSHLTELSELESCGVNKLAQCLAQHHRI